MISYLQQFAFFDKSLSLLREGMHGVHAMLNYYECWKCSVQIGIKTDPKMWKEILHIVCKTLLQIISSDILRPGFKSKWSPLEYCSLILFVFCTMEYVTLG